LALVEDHLGAAARPMKELVPEDEVPQMEQALTILGLALLPDERLAAAREHSEAESVRSLCWQQEQGWSLSEEEWTC
jgi:hypothetical protein